ncbi:Uncharacterized protein GBIM_19485 [Gryllus bimaculatus]|nr:Uncharacterized protein GBIM_19485 [Gryllus bimaculatus]
MAMSPAERLLVLAAVWVALAARAAWAVPRPGGDDASASDPAPGVVGAKKFATAVDCNGAVAFSSKGAARAAGAGAAGQLHFAADLTDKSVGWSRDAGEFTTFCPGLYQFAFSSGGAANARLALKKKASGGAAWEAVVSTGAGGANVVLLNMDVGDSTAVFLEDGTLDDAAATSATFSGFRVAKKTP